jgi:hypothetical protein
MSKYLFVRVQALRVNWFACAIGFGSSLNEQKLLYHMLVGGRYCRTDAGFAAPLSGGPEAAPAARAFIDLRQGLCYK